MHSHEPGLEHPRWWDCPELDLPGPALVAVGCRGVVLEVPPFEGDGRRVEGQFPAVHPSVLPGTGGVEGADDCAEALHGSMLVGEVVLADTLDEDR